MGFFEGKICVVTGGGSGLGRALCQQLAGYGANVTVADLNEQAAQKVVEEIVNEGGTAAAFYVDVTNPESVEKLVNETLARFGKLDFMFNNAGITVTGEFRDLPLGEIKKVLDVNLFGVVHGSHFAYKTMISQGFGHIVNTASGFGLAPGPTQSPYVTSKFGIVGMSETLRIEGLDLGVKVSVVCPGYIQTPLVENVRTFNASSKDVLSQVPVKMVRVDEAARLILKGVEKNKAIIKFPKYVSLLVFLYRFLPGLFLQQALKNIRNFRAIRKASDSQEVQSPNR